MHQQRLVVDDQKTHKGQNGTGFNWTAFSNCLALPDVTCEGINKTWARNGLPLRNRLQELT